MASNLADIATLPDLVQPTLTINETRHAVKVAPWTTLLDLLREHLDLQPDIEIILASQSSPELAGALMRGKADVAFLRREKDAPRYRVQASNQGAAGRGAAGKPSSCPPQKTVRVQDLAHETFLAPRCRRP
jgi:hypothetical protein